MTLRIPCEHGRYESHDLLGDPGCPQPGCQQHASTLHCQGGEFLADDALVIEKGTARTVIALEIAGYHMTEADADAAASRIVDGLIRWESSNA